MDSAASSSAKGRSVPRAVRDDRAHRGHAHLEILVDRVDVEFADLSRSVASRFGQQLAAVEIGKRFRFENQCGIMTKRAGQIAPAPKQQRRNPPGKIKQTRPLETLDTHAHFNISYRAAPDGAARD